MFSIALTNESNNFLKDIRKVLKNKGYNKTISKTNRSIGGIRLNSIFESYTKPGSNIMFEIEKDLINNEIITVLWFKENESLNRKEIMLSSIKDLC